MIYLVSGLVSFVAVFLRGWQQKNVVGGHYKTAFLTSYVMAMFDVFAVAIIMSGGWTVAFSSGTGAAIGIVSAMALHNRLFKNRKQEN